MPPPQSSTATTVDTASLGVCHQHSEFVTIHRREASMVILSLLMLLCTIKGFIWITVNKVVGVKADQTFTIEPMIN